MPRLSDIALPETERISPYTQFVLSIPTGGTNCKVVSRAFHLPHSIFAVYDKSLFYTGPEEMSKGKTVTYENLKAWVADTLAMTKKDLIMTTSTPGTSSTLIHY